MHFEHTQSKQHFYDDDITEKMMFVQKIFIFLILSWIDCSIYVYNTQDSLSVEYYDCIYYQSFNYCRRPSRPIPLERENKTWNCSHNGTIHSFSSLWMNDINVSTILFNWKSGIDKAEEYSHYINQLIKSNERNQFICECTDRRSFGKNCEYLLLDGTTFGDTASTKFYWNSTMRMYGGDIVCYKTLKCNFGLLCLDWRDICDGKQQCMLGYDEENCDKIEFNECEDDEYRCMNGMCIPEEYFLDGEYDCMDMSDEREYFRDTDCPFQLASFQCDDRICPPRQWPCGDGQCIIDRLTIIKPWSEQISCMNRRDQYYICETNSKENLMTLPNGQCYEELNTKNRSINNYCNYLIGCSYFSKAEKYCPCKRSDTCTELFQNSCSSLFPIQYPNGGLIGPYIFAYYNVTYNPLRILAFSKVNGTIKCRGYKNSFSTMALTVDIDLRIIEGFLCELMSYQSNFSIEGYHQSCHNDSKTFNNRSYNFVDVCRQTKECISAQRIKDGIPNCYYNHDEQQGNEIVSKSCSTVRRHRFRCSIEQTTCVYAHLLGDSHFDCINKYDESWMGTQILLSKVNCNNQLKDGCQLLRRYIESSWNSNKTNDSNLEDISIKRIPFRSYCDTFWDLASKEDENVTMCQSSWICPQEQWQCFTGQCIHIDWVLDGEWDCPDASDEENMFAVNFNVSHGNYQLVKSRGFKKKFMDKYAQQPFGTTCNLTIEYPCYPINVNDYSDKMRPCIDLKLIGNGQVDCIGGYDERNVLDHCHRSFTALGYDFKCLSSNTCIAYSDICKTSCPNTKNYDKWCTNFENNTHYSQPLKFKCINGTPIEYRRCDGSYDCLNGEDEYMCDRGRSSDVLYRKQKQISIGMKIQKLELPRFPNNTNSTQVLHTSNTTQSTTTLASDLILRNSSIPDWCNRGIGMLISNNSIVCFCPPQYHGDHCQYHTDRISVYLHLNLTNSIYTTSSDKTIVIKLLVLFLFENQVLGTDELHIRPAVEIDVYKKKRNYFHYSRSLELLEHKQKRYFNRSNIINKHPYSIRIEAYQMKVNEKSTRFAVWQYLMYFDFLPVYRFAKVLQLTKPNIHDEDPCTSNPCHQNEECYQLLNQKSQYICLCKSNFSGTNCTDLHPLCNNSYCSSNALCQPAYRGKLNGYEYPYCICSIGQIGHRCKLIHTMCLKNPCGNGGTCYQRSTPNEYICECTPEYEGITCNQAKQSVRLYINKKNPIESQGIVVQYFNLNFDLFELILVNQSVYFNLPDSLLYLHSRQSAPEIIILKRYFSDQSEIYIISLHLSVISIEGTTSITEKNRCIPLHSLSPSEISIFQYHDLCRNNHSLFCFRDEKYICICDEMHTRVECFNYDYHLDHCSHCRADGHCLKGGQNDFICICPPCHSGKICQFNFESFSFTLDQLFFQDLLSNNQIIQQTTFYSLIITPCLLFLLGLINNICCFITFRRPKCLRNGIGQYLFYMTIVNQINLTILVIRLIHLTVNISNPYSYPIFDNALCKTSSYLLTSSTRITYWINSLIAIERIYVVLFLNGQWLKKPHIARRLIAFTMISILTMSAYDLVFIQSEVSSDDGHNAICVLNFPSNTHSWKVVHNVVTIINALIPFLINLCCTITIMYIVTKKKMNANVRDTDNPLAMTTIKYNRKEHDISMKKLKDTNKPSPKDCNLNNNQIIPESDVNISEIQLLQSKVQSRFRLLIDVLIENKELVIAPAFTLIPQLFSLPFFIASFSLRCQNIQGHHLRYLLITSYFTTFIPQLTSFFLYISPSSFYSKEWDSTVIGKWINSFKQTHQPITLAMKTTNIDANNK